MSGAFGWVRNDATNLGGTRVRADSGFADARQAYGRGAQRVNVGFDPNVGKQRKMDSFATRVDQVVPGAKQVLKSTASNVVVVVLDVTASMAEWPKEIFQRLPLLYTELCEHVGSDDLEILFIAHGDVRSDRYPIQVTRFGKGPELDTLLASIKREGGGGGQGTESQELVAYYVAERVDTSTAQNVFTVFVTDEAGCDTVDLDQVVKHLGIAKPREAVSATNAFAALEQKGDVYAIVCETGSYDPTTIKQWWRRTIHPERVLELNDARRVVDVILGIVATTLGRYDQFRTKLLGRQVGTKFGRDNVTTVDGTLALIRNGATMKFLPPPAQSGDDGGTRSLLD